MLPPLLPKQSYSKWILRIRRWPKNQLRFTILNSEEDLLENKRQGGEKVLFLLIIRTHYGQGGVVVVFPPRFPFHKTKKTGKKVFRSRSGGKRKKVSVESRRDMDGMATAASNRTRLIGFSPGDIIVKAREPGKKFTGHGSSSTIYLCLLCTYDSVLLGECWSHMALLSVRLHFLCVYPFLLLSHVKTKLSED